MRGAVCHSRAMKSSAPDWKAFRDPKRSSMVFQLATIVSHGLLTQDELQCLTPAIRETVESLSKSKAGWSGRDRA